MITKNESACVHGGVTTPSDDVAIAESKMWRGCGTGDSTEPVVCLGLSRCTAHASQRSSTECRSGVWWGADQVTTSALSKRLNTAVGEGQVLTKGRGRKTECVEITAH